MTRTCLWFSSYPCTNGGKKATRGRESLDGGSNGDSGFLRARVSRQEMGSKEKEDERSLNRFYSDKNSPPGPLKHGVRTQRSIY